MRQDKRNLISECLGALLLLLVVFSASFTSVVDAFGDVVKITDVSRHGNGGHSAFPVGIMNLEESNRKKREIFTTALGIGEVVIALTDFVTGNVRQSFDNSGNVKDHQEIIAHFERIQMELEKQTEELQSINQEIKNLGLSIIYFEHEDKIKYSLLTLIEYLGHPNDRNRNVFIEKASHLGQSIRVLVDGLLGQHTFTHDIMAVMRDAAKCHGRKLRKNVKSVGSLIMTGLYVRGQYQRIINATEGDSSPFKKYIDASLPKLKTRLDAMVVECQADETNVSDEMRNIMEATLTPNRRNITNALLNFLEEKYDTKKWVVLVQEKSWENSVRTGRFHHASVRNDVAFAISVDPREENVPAFGNLTEKSLGLKDFKIPVKCYDVCETCGFYAPRAEECYCLSSFEIESHLNRILIPIRNDGIELATLIASSYDELQNLTVATSQGVGNRFNSKSTNDMVDAKNSQFNVSQCYHWVIVISVSFNLDRRSHSTPCHYDLTDQTIEDYGPLRNEYFQAYLSVRGDSNEEGASVILDRYWRNSPGQKWKFVDNQLRNGFGKCLTAESYYFYQYNCDGYKLEQRWHRHGLQITNYRKFCLTFQGELDQDPMYVRESICRALSPFVWYNRDTSCEDAMVIPSTTTNGSRPLRNEFSRLFLNAVEKHGGQYGTEQPWSNRPRQLWKFVDGGLLRNEEGKCLAGSGWFVWLVDCADQMRGNGRWTYTENRQIKSQDGYCLSSAAGSFLWDDYRPEGCLYYDYCRDDPRQRWWYFS